jgi:methylmalonyl-CoA/ethylmalonyl-CoA epimerase
MTLPGERFALSEIGQIAFSVSDIAAATSFYRDVLGLTHLFSAPPGLAFFAAGSIRLMLAQPEKPGEAPQPNSILYFKVGDIASAQRELTARGARFESESHCIAKLPDHDLWMTFLRDPDRNRIGLMSEVRNQR